MRSGRRARGVAGAPRPGQREWGHRHRAGDTHRDRPRYDGNTRELGTGSGESTGVCPTGTWVHRVGVGTPGLASCVTASQAPEDPHGLPCPAPREHPLTRTPLSPAGSARARPRLSIPGESPGSAGAQSPQLCSRPCSLLPPRNGVVAARLSLHFHVPNLGGATA